MTATAARTVTIRATNDTLIIDWSDASTWIAEDLTATVEAHFTSAGYEAPAPGVIAKVAIEAMANLACAIALAASWRPGDDFEPPAVPVLNIAGATELPAESKNMIDHAVANLPSSAGYALLVAAGRA